MRYEINIRELADHLHLSSADLLCLARESAEDGVLRSINHMTGHQQFRLLGSLLELQALDEELVTLLDYEPSNIYLA